jgi:hypothetical protein
VCMRPRRDPDMRLAWVPIDRYFEAVEARDWAEIDRLQSHIRPYGYAGLGFDQCPETARMSAPARPGSGGYGARGGRVPDPERKRRRVPGKLYAGAGAA